MKKIILAIILSTIINPVLASDSDGTGVQSLQYCELVDLNDTEIKSDSDGTGNPETANEDSKGSNYVMVCNSIEKK